MELPAILYSCRKVLSLGQNGIECQEELQESKQFY